MECLDATPPRRLGTVSGADNRLATAGQADAVGEVRAGKPVPWLGRLDASARRRPWAVDTVLALVLLASLGAVSLSGIDGLMMPGWVRGALVTALVVLHCCVAVRRQWPVLAFAAASLAMLVIVVLPSARTTLAATGQQTQVPLRFIPSCLLYALMLASVSARCSRREAALALAVGAAGVGVSAARLAASPVAGLTSSPWGLAFVLVALAAMVAAAWGIGRLVAARAVMALSERAHLVERAVAAERAAMSREMHDVVAHSLAVIVRQAEAGSYVAASAPDKAAETLQVIADTGRDALADMRGVLKLLATPADRQRGGDAAGTPGPATSGGGIRGLAAVPDLLAAMRRAGLTVDLDQAGTQVPLPSAIDLAAYRVLQESLTNSLKHSGAGTRAAARLEWSARQLVIEVADDGAGGGQVVPGSGLGLPGLRERLRAVHGDLDAGPRAGGGFAVRARISLPAREGG